MDELKSRKQTTKANKSKCKLNKDFSRFDNQCDSYVLKMHQHSINYNIEGYNDYYLFLSFWPIQHTQKYIQNALLENPRSPIYSLSKNSVENTHFLNYGVDLYALQLLVRCRAPHETRQKIPPRVVYGIHALTMSTFLTCSV